MDRKQLKQYRALRNEVADLDKSIDKLRDKALEIPVVMGKVTGSSHDFPYIEERITVRMDEPREADMIAKRIRIKERRREEAERQAVEIEEFIAKIPDSTGRRIFEMVFLEGKKQREVAGAVGYSQGRVAQKISSILQD